MSRPQKVSKGGTPLAARPLRISSEAQFSALLNSLVDDTAHALMHWKLYVDLSAAVRRYVVEFNDSAAFWRLTHQAQWQTALSRLARLYDDYPGTLSLPNFLATVRANVHLFDEERFRERLKGNPFVENLAVDARRPDLATLNADARTVSALTPQVRKLLVLRHRLLAHRDVRIVHGKADPLFELTRRDIAFLCARAKMITNRYLRLFRASTDMMRLVGDDDYKRVLEHVRNGRKTRRREIDRQIALAMRPAKKARA